MSLEHHAQVSKDVLIMNADRFFLEEVGSVTKADTLRKREVQVNTRMHYAQRRCASCWLPSMLVQPACTNSRYPDATAGTIHNVHDMNEVPAEGVWSVQPASGSGGKYATPACCAGSTS